jgi:molybdenum cofactor biosynthesis protein B
MAKVTDGSSQGLSIAVLTVSDTRTGENDTSGDYLVQALEAAGHHTRGRAIVRDDIYQIRAILSAWIADANINAVLITGGTGFSGRDSTPEAVRPLFDKDIEGFGEVFRALSYAEIGSSTVQSRALAGFANDTVIFCMPGSTGACKTAWNGVIREQLDSSHRPGAGSCRRPSGSREH